MHLTIHSHFLAARQLLDHYLGLRFVNPLVTEEYIPFLRAAVDLLLDVIEALEKCDHTAPEVAQLPPLQQAAALVVASEMESHLPKLLARLDRLLHHLSSIASPTQPDWLHYYLQKRMQDFYRAGHLHLVFSPVDNQDDFYYSDYYYVFRRELNVILKSLRALPTFHADKHKRHAARIRHFKHRHVLLQCAPRHISLIPHLAVLSMHEFGHHLQRYGRSPTKPIWTIDKHIRRLARRYVAARVPDDSSFPGSLEASKRLNTRLGEELQKPGPGTTILTALVATHLEEVFSDLFAMWRTGPLPLLVLRDNLLQLDKDENPLARPTTWSTKLLWLSTFTHPPPILRLKFMVDMIRDAAYPPDLRKTLCLGRFAAILGRTTVVEIVQLFRQYYQLLPTNASMDQVILDQARIEAGFAADAVAWLRPQILALVQRVCQQGQHGQKRPFPALDNSRLRQALSCIDSIVPATEVLREKPAPLTHAFAAAYLVWSKHGRGWCTFTSYAGRLEVVLKTIEDLSMVELYANVLD